MKDRILNAVIGDIEPVQASINEDEEIEASVGNFLGYQLKFNFVFNQNVASNHWVIQHNLNKIHNKNNHHTKQCLIYQNLNKFCSVVVVDSSNHIVYPEIIYKDLNTIEVISEGAFSGKAFCN